MLGFQAASSSRQYFLQGSSCNFRTNEKKELTEHVLTTNPDHSFEFHISQTDLKLTMQSRMVLTFSLSCLYFSSATVPRSNRTFFRAQLRHQNSQSLHTLESRKETGVISWPCLLIQTYTLQITLVHDLDLSASQSIQSVHSLVTLDRGPVQLCSVL